MGMLDKLRERRSGGRLADDELGRLVRVALPNHDDDDQRPSCREPFDFRNAHSLSASASSPQREASAPRKATTLSERGMPTWGPTSVRDHGACPTAIFNPRPSPASYHWCQWLDDVVPLKLSELPTSEFAEWFVSTFLGSRPTVQDVSRIERLIGAHKLPYDHATEVWKFARLRIQESYTRLYYASAVPYAGS